jgi:unsaturated rhamnogalacturonyl hydrolase
MQHLTDEVLGRVFGNALNLDLESDYWERQGAMVALLQWEHPDGLTTVRRWLDRAVATQTTDGRLCYGGSTQLSWGAFRVMDVGIMRQFVSTPSVSAYFAHPLALLAERTGDQAYLDAAARQMAAVAAGPRTSEGFLRMNGAVPEVWIDEVYPICAAFARLGRTLDRPDWVDEAYRHVLIAGERLVDPRTGLARHIWSERPDSFPESTFWSRGNGWLIGAAAEVLTEAPDHPDAAQARELLDGMLRAISARQDRSGFLHDTLDDPQSPLEASGTVMFAYAAALAVAISAVDASAADGLVDSSSRALDAVAGIVEEDGSIGRIVLPPGGPGVPFGKLAIGQSFFLLAAFHLRKELGLALLR